MIASVVFDLGGVLIDWNPRHLYRKLIADTAEMDYFLDHICPLSWNEHQDAGRPLAEATAIQCAAFPEYRELIRAYYGRWDEMLVGAIEGAVELLNDLHARNIPLYALTNWSAETFPIAQARYEFLKLFRTIVMSGEEKLVKPNPAFFERLQHRCALQPHRTLFIDDNLANIQSASRLGYHVHHFRDPQCLAAELSERRLL